VTSGTGASGEQVAKRARDELGTVSILVNNAGVVWPLGPSLNVHPDEWAAAIAVNVLAAAGLTFALLPGMLGQEWGASSASPAASPPTRSR
jgi:3-oxoacyl-[acyl-carrier protein] reductase